MTRYNLFRAGPRSAVSIRAERIPTPSGVRPTSHSDRRPPWRALPKAGAVPRRARRALPKAGAVPRRARRALPKAGAVPRRGDGVFAPAPDDLELLPRAGSGRLSCAGSAVTLEVSRLGRRCLRGAVSVNIPENAPGKPGCRCRDAGWGAENDSAVTAAPGVPLYGQATAQAGGGGERCGGGPIVCGGAAGLSCHPVTGQAPGGTGVCAGTSKRKCRGKCATTRLRLAAGSAWPLRGPGRNERCAGVLFALTGMLRILLFSGFKKM